MESDRTVPGGPFLADECTFTKTVRRMEEAGCDVTRIQDLGLSGASDAKVLQKAKALGAVLVTTDRGFGDIWTYPPSSHHGIILLKARSRAGASRPSHTGNTFDLGNQL